MYYFFIPDYGDQFLQKHAIQKGDIVKLAEDGKKPRGRLPKNFRYIQKNDTVELCSRTSIVSVAEVKQNIEHKKWLYFNLNDKKESTKIININVKSERNWTTIDIYADAKFTDGEFVFKTRQDMDKFMDFLGSYIEHYYTTNFIFNVEYLQKRNMKAGRPFQ